MANITEYSLSSPVYGVAHNNGNWVIVGAEGKVYSSSNPLNSGSWKESSVGSDVILRAVAYGDGGWTVAGDRSAIYYTSSANINEGTSWKKVSDPGEPSSDLSTAGRGLTLDGEASYSFHTLGFDGTNWLAGGRTPQRSEVSAGLVGGTDTDSPITPADDSRLGDITIPTAQGTLVQAPFNAAYTSYTVHREADQNITLTFTRPSGVSSTIEDCVAVLWTSASTGGSPGVLPSTQVLTATLSADGNSSTCTLAASSGNLPNNEAHRIYVTVTSENKLYSTEYTFTLLGSELHMATANVYTSSLSSLIIELNAGNPGDVCTADTTNDVPLNRVDDAGMAQTGFDSSTDIYHVSLAAGTTAVKICTGIAGNTGASVQRLGTPPTDAMNGNFVIDDLEDTSTQGIGISVTSADANFASRRYIIYILGSASTTTAADLTLTRRDSRGVTTTLIYSGELWSATDPSKLQVRGDNRTADGWIRILPVLFDDDTSIPVPNPVLDMAYHGEDERWLIAGNRGSVSENFYASLKLPYDFSSEDDYDYGLGGLQINERGGLVAIAATSLGIAHSNNTTVMLGQGYNGTALGGGVLYNIPGPDELSQNSARYFEDNNNIDIGVREYSDAVLSGGKWILGGTHKNEANRVLLIAPINEDKPDLSGDLVDLKAPEGGLPEFPNYLRLEAGIRR